MKLEHDFPLGTPKNRSNIKDQNFNPQTSESFICNADLIQKNIPMLLDLPERAAL